MTDTTRVTLSGPHGVVFDGTSAEFGAAAGRVRAALGARSNHIDGSIVQSFRDRIVEIEKQRRALADSIAALVKDAATAGLNKRALKEMVKRALESDDERRARERAEAALAEMEAALDALRLEEAAE